MVTHRSAEDVALQNGVPRDWRKRSIASLSEPGVILPPDRPWWHEAGERTLKAIGWSLAGLGYIYAAVLLVQGLGHLSVILATIVGVGFVIGAPFFVYNVVWPGLRYYFGRFGMATFGTNPIRALQESYSPPVLYLRSFEFDPVASRVFGWVQLLYAVGGVGVGNAQSPEITVARELWRLGPAIAIGKPEEVAAPPGMMRIYVGHDMWKRKVAELAQCASNGQCRRSGTGS